MNLGPLLPTEENIARFRAELAEASEATLIAQEAKDPNMAPGIAAKQLLADFRAKREAESRKPHLTQTLGFIAACVFGVFGVIAWLYPRQPPNHTQTLPSPLPPASSQAGAVESPTLAPLAKPQSPAASAPQAIPSQSK
jgi:hypothetical protein